jgi:hypothetical protein
LAYNRTQASNLLSAEEMALFDASLADRVKALGAAELRKQVKRTRTLRDKSSDLLQRQKIATRGRTGTKLGPEGDANERTERKVVLLGETLSRFEKRLALLEPAAQPEAKGPAGKALASLPASATDAPATRRSRAAATQRQGTCGRADGGQAHRPGQRQCPRHGQDFEAPGQGQPCDPGARERRRAPQPGQARRAELNESVAAPRITRRFRSNWAIPTRPAICRPLT